MTEINKGFVLLLELIIAVGAILFFAGLCIEIFNLTAPMTSELGVILGGVLVLIGGFSLAFYSSKPDKTENAVH
ncbi:hypothetical protein MmiEs2_03640 [Methanimicrococcus stummii]|uniref:Uncharacterized protein n=1 Tax=Methanimicrococcus stummii TaxID=3028294 RepID=A0AA96V959_9EURY|nr:hypothetical protein [Methanimicrococcus sp. Es2]WNY28181.1 hypothetical protein MmiEs2_03640 [Methanimicrococcus sp. Es2]